MRTVLLIIGYAGVGLGFVFMLIIVAGWVLEKAEAGKR